MSGNKKNRIIVKEISWTKPEYWPPPDLRHQVESSSLFELRVVGHCVVGIPKARGDPIGKENINGVVTSTKE